MHIRSRKTSGWAAVVGFGALALAGVSSLEASGETVSLEGSWSGGGQIVFPSGESERARCRASFRRQGGDSFGMSATCATASARVQQSAEVTRVSGNRFRGEFFNQEYGISGSIRITVQGNSLNASLSGGGGSAQFSLSR
ncbi:MAG: hypothetical protein SFW09_11905 [Hyphomicrobiaceae bacterium]|nr:hypothetical protein [Hyphomicrobiaceae bacterium]